MTRLNLVTGREPGVWSRLHSRIHEMRYDSKHGELRALYRAMAEEQRQDGIRRGATVCDLPWCGCAASHVWTRTAADLKAMRRKHKGAWLEGAPQSVRCETHIPAWRVSDYRPIQTAQAVAA